MLLATVLVSSAVFDVSLCVDRLRAGNGTEAGSSSTAYIAETK